MTAQQPAHGAERQLDDVDRTLIAMLADDGRASFTALAKAVDLSEGAVRQRVQRLLREQAMRIVALTDPATVGLRCQATVGVRVTGDAREVATVIADLEHVRSVVLTAGSFDILCELACRDDDHLLSVLNDELRRLPGVLGTETFMALDVVKRATGWPGAEPED